MIVTVTQLRAEHRADSLGIGVAVPAAVVDRRVRRLQRSGSGRTRSIADDPDDPDAEQRRTRRSRTTRCSSRGRSSRFPRGPAAGSASASPARTASSRRSDPLDVEVALLDPADWTALPITAAFPECCRRATDQVPPAASPSAPAVIRARLYVSALGVYTVACNGARLGDEVLAPGWTSYRHRLRYSTLDVTEAIGDGDNVLGITVAEGWYRGRLGFHGGTARHLRHRHRSGRPARTALRRRHAATPW